MMTIEDINKFVLEFFTANPKQSRFKHQGHVYYRVPKEHVDMEFIVHTPGCEPVGTVKISTRDLIEEEPE